MKHRSNTERKNPKTGRAYSAELSVDQPKKSLGQHWLYDESYLRAVVAAAEVVPGDTVLEIGPGKGTLTNQLLATGADVVAVELDERLAEGLMDNVKVPEKLRVIAADILTFDLSALPPLYKVAANIPYYLTSHLVRVLLESANPPSVMSLLMQKEVAERIAARPGKMSILAVSVQYYCDVALKEIVPAEKFDPPPKVDSQIIQLKRKGVPLYPDTDSKQYFKVVKAGFSNPRKTLLNSLSAGLRIDKAAASALLEQANVKVTARAQELTLSQWADIAKATESSKIENK